MENNKKLSIACFGEVLFDIFPTHSKIGGAPLNVANRLSYLGIDAHLISRIGNDVLGKEIIKFLEVAGITIETIQVDDSFPTGAVMVSLDKSGSASYTIAYPAAWDKIKLNREAVSEIKNSDALVFGSLACRDSISYHTLKDLVELANYKIFDVNLRPPFYTKELLIDLMGLADLIKFNEEELLEIAGLLGCPLITLNDLITFIAKETNTKTICVTRGGDGAVLLFEGNVYTNNGYKVKVADTVGAGDSFFAGLISQLLVGEDPQESLDFACAMGALVASKEGANPTITLDEIEKIRKEI